MDGVVISTHGALDRLERLSETQVYVEAGVPCARVAKQCIKWGLGPAEFFAGIPGTMGGALAMNAGAFGGETWQHVIEVETIDRHGREHDAHRCRVPGELSPRRGCQSRTSGSWRAKLSFERRPARTKSKCATLLARRKASQPIGEWSGGSVFTNPPGDHAARLIEAAGLKGYRVGDAVGVRRSTPISSSITGRRRAADIEQLIEHVQDTVERLHGVRLQPEVRIVGDERTN